MIDRITVLGGSSVYIPEFVSSVITHNLNVKEIVLQGRSGRKLEIVRNFCLRLADKAGFPLKITPELDVAAAVTGAKYIINHVRVGGMKARLRDEMLPPQFNLVGDEQLGPGAITNALRTLPVALEHARIIESAAPKAVLINMGNPMGILVEALSSLTSLTVIGACDLHRVYTRKIASVLNVDPSALCVDYVGLYHLGWIQDVKVDGRSQMSHLLELLEARGEEDFDYDLIELFRMIPTQVTGMYFHRAEVLKRQQNCPRFRAEVLYEAEQQILRMYENPHLNSIPDLTRQRDAAWYEETIMPLILGMEGATPVSTVACLPNNGAIKDLCDESSVEIPVTISRKGVKARKVGLLPRFLKGVFWSIKESDRLTIEAYRQKSFDLALQAMAVNPFVDSVTRARKYLEKVVKLESLGLH
ncbi:MAG: hypothetical protein GX580_01655 [Candidatus Hydrogenedens sp.]|nr:hypothetical protein [Candidatus Hydrogenedentota bacterium]NLF56321.1 hypothetical protein [Candidatus Hydrogenedens sp.]